MPGYRLSRELSEEIAHTAKREKMCIVYLLRFIGNKLLIVIKEVFQAFRFLLDFAHRRLTNLCLFITNNPPAVLFIFNVLLFAIILSCVILSLTVSKNIKSALQLKNILEEFSQLELCIVPFVLNTTLGNKYSSHKSSAAKNNKVVKFKTHHIPIRLSIHPNSDYLSTNSSVSSLSTSMYGKYMGLKGKKSKTIINITLTYEHHFNTSCRRGNSLMQVSCHVDDVPACVSFTAPVNVFPDNELLNQCSPIPPDEATYKAGLNWQLADVDAFYYCRSRTTIKASFDTSFTKPKFSAYEVKATTKKHLLNTTVFLFFFLLICFFYAIFCQHNPPYRPTKPSSL